MGAHLPVSMDKAFYKAFRRGNATAVSQGIKAGFLKSRLFHQLRIAKDSGAFTVGNQFPVTEGQGPGRYIPASDAYRG